MAKTNIIILICMIIGSIGLNAQSISLPIDTTVITKHKTTINGQPISYTAQTGTQPVWDEMGKPIASNSERPLLISFNGGPGSASVWMHVAYTGPQVLKIDEEGYPVQPYGIQENPFSVLDVCDIVFVNPANTGYSRTIPMSGKDVDKKKFFGINADIKYLAGWLNTFVSRNNRWRSPKYLIGESYGGTNNGCISME